MRTRGKTKVTKRVWNSLISFLILVVGVVRVSKITSDLRYGQRFRSYGQKKVKNVILNGRTRAYTQNARVHTRKIESHQKGPGFSHIKPHLSSGVPKGGENHLIFALGVAV